MPGILLTPPPLMAAGYPVKRLFFGNLTPSFIPSMKLGSPVRQTTLSYHKITTSPQGALFARSVPKLHASEAGITTWGNFTSDPLAFPVLLTGTVTLAMWGADTTSASFSTASASHYHYVYVTVGNTNSIRANVVVGAGADHGAGIFIWNASGRGEVFTMTIGTPFTAQAGDRIVVEEGVFFGNNGNQRSAVIYAGGVDPTALFNDDTNANHHAWLQFNSIPGVQF